MAGQGGGSGGADVLSALIGGGFNMWGQDRANKYSREAAQKQMDFQERMSSTAHTREVRDLRNAGLNPILSATGGGSSSPSGAMPQIKSITEAASSSAQGAVRLMADLRAIKAQTENLKEQKPGIRANSVIAQAQAFSAAQVLKLQMKNPEKWAGLDILLKRLGLGGKAGPVSFSSRGGSK